MAAAKGDPNRQTLFSRQIRELETALGVSLLDRSSVPHGLTRAGVGIELLMREFTVGIEGIVEEQRGECPLVTIGAGESIIQWLLLPNLKAEMNGSHVRLKFQNLTSRGVLKALRSRRIDLGVISRRDPGSDFVVEELASYGVVAIGREFGRARRIRWADLGEAKLAVLEGEGRIRSRVDEFLQSETGGSE